MCHISLIGFLLENVSDTQTQPSQWIPAVNTSSSLKSESGEQILYIAANNGCFTFKQGQGNQCQIPGVKFEELTGWKKGKNGKKLEETGRNGKTEEKTRPKVKIKIFGENMVFGEIFFFDENMIFVKTWFS